ncbi:MAG: hypothetical protein KDJ38_01530 [Gammaproteobacteria bacterium]|nr:hypothetical protein [Gammaproteobacteria bacterium]
MQISCISRGALVWGLFALAPLSVSLNAWCAGAKPVQPAPDEVVLTLPGDSRSDATLQTLRDAVRRQPDNTDAVANLTRHYLSLAERHVDPRMAGMADALLDKQPVFTPRLLALKARQQAFSHNFEAALETLDKAVDLSPDNIELRLHRANYRMLQSDFSGADRDCRQISDSGDSLLGAFCQSRLTAYLGEPLLAQAVQSRLAPLLSGNKDMQAWISTVQAETAWLADDIESARSHFENALDQYPGFAYTLRRLADIALIQARYADVLAMIPTDSNVDALILRATHAALLAGDDKRLNEGRERYEQRRKAIIQSLRILHPADEAYYFTHISPDADAAIKAARQNWAQQQSPEDWQLLAQASALSGGTATLPAFPPWITERSPLIVLNTEVKQ